MRTKRYIRLGREDGVEDTPPPILIPEQENILDNGRQAQLRKRAIQTSLHERCPLPLQRPLAPHVPLQTQGKALSAPERSAALIYCYGSVFFKIYFANAGDPRHGHFAVEVVLHGILAEEQVHLVIVTIRAVEALGHNVHVDKVWLWNNR